MRLTSVIGKLLPNEDNFYLEQALYTTVSSLRRKVRDMAWSIVRRSYRELVISPTTDTAEWLSRTLLLAKNGKKRNEEVEIWLESKRREGHVVQMGLEGRWIIRKIM